jgi:hypothetical protein
MLDTASTSEAHPAGPGQFGGLAAWTISRRHHTDEIVPSTVKCGGVIEESGRAAHSAAQAPGLSERLGVTGEAGQGGLERSQFPSRCFEDRRAAVESVRGRHLQHVGGSSGVSGDGP